MNYKIQNLRDDFQQLKTESVRAEENSFSNSFSGASSYSDLSSQNSNSNNVRCPCSLSSGSAASNVQTVDPLYMYGDTTKTLVIDGIPDRIEENLGEIILRCINEIGITLLPDDIESVYRISNTNPDKKWPRPVKLTLKDQTKRDQIFIFKSRLRQTDIYQALKIHKEQRKDLRVRAAKLRQAGLTAQKMGHRVDFRPDQIRIDGRHYNTLTLHTIPPEFMTEANETKYHPRNTRRLTLIEKCRTKADNVVMVGPSLQKKNLGLAFYSYKCFLSNFYPCKITFRGQEYSTLEQGYQCTKAEICRDRTAYYKILHASNTVEMKRLGGDILTNDNWEKYKLTVMEDLICAKFTQNKDLYYMLLNTRPLNLIEATIDEFWGAGCIFGSIALDEGRWDGKSVGKTPG